MTLYRHWRDVPGHAWRWAPAFLPQEIASRGDGSLLVDPAALDALLAARMAVDRPFRISSAYRDPLHNARVGGAPRSSHKEGHAFDIALAGLDRDMLHRALRAAGFRGFGLRYNSFIHADMGRERVW